ncbi:MAG TPA: RES family NAD+ phosphorylase [Vicinamibacterales bacterium]
MPTWTRAALSPERRALSGTCWRLVEAQHHVPTMKLVDTLAEQRVLESIVEETKPPVPAECRGLHYLLATPFRYGAPYPGGSRFRRAGLTAGVFYASQAVDTAVAEMVFHRLLFFADSPATAWPARAGEFTAFSARYRSAAALDLGAAPLDADRASWTDPIDYAPCQALADAARDAGVELLRYPSARDAGGVNLALLSCRAFGAREPQARETWRIALGEHGARALRDMPDRGIEFGREAFAADHRIAALRWER